MVGGNSLEVLYLKGGEEVDELLARVSGHNW